MDKMVKRKPSKAAKRALIARLRRRAPKHPAGPEAQIRHAVARVMLAVNREIRMRIRLIGPSLLRRARQDAHGTDSLEHALDSARAYGKYVVQGAPFHAAVFGASYHTAQQTNKQVKDALGKETRAQPDLSKQINDLATSVIDRTSELVSDAVDRADEVVGEWLDLDPDLSERAEDLDALDAMLVEDQDGNTGKALAAAALAFGLAFAAMNRIAQEDSGAGTYLWLSQKDSRVRPAHAQLDEETASWDDPPLKADVSDNEEDDHPGEDYGCRCVASPLTPEDEEILGV